jgi:hypothetical protein
MTQIFFIVNKKTARLGGFYCCLLLYSSFVINLKKSFGAAPVAANIFDMLAVDGQRGCSYLENLLLLLKVVGSKPLRLANPEQDRPCSRANNSMACQI